MKAVRAALLLIMALALCGGCSRDIPAPAEPSGFLFTAEYGGKSAAVAVDAPMAPVLAALGEPRAYFEEVSCAFEGRDKHFDYGSFEILTRPGNEGDLIQAVYLLDDLVSTREGLRIGASEEDMLRIYGDGFTAFGLRRSYERGGMTLEVIIRDGRVALITYSSAFSAIVPE